MQHFPWLAFLVLGVVFANRWLVNSPPKIARFSKSLRVITLIGFSWIGLFVVSSVSREIGYRENDGIAYDGNVEVPYDVMYDGTGDNAFNLFFGWVSGFLFWGIAKSIPSSRPEN